MVRILPPIVIVVPIFLVVERLGLLNTRLGLIVVYAAFNVTIVVWMMESFFREIPVDLEEAAMVDGDTRFTAFRRIVLPLAAPGLVATGDLRGDHDVQRVPLRARPHLDPAAETMPVGRHADRPHQRRLGSDERGRRRRRPADRGLRRCSSRDTSCAVSPWVPSSRPSTTGVPCPRSPSPTLP